MSDEDYEDLTSCLSDEEKKIITGRNFIEKFWIKQKMKRQAKKSEVYDAMIDNIENGSINDFILEKYKKEEQIMKTRFERKSERINTKKRKITEEIMADVCDKKTKLNKKSLEKKLLKYAKQISLKKV